MPMAPKPTKPAFDAQKFLDEYQDNLSPSLKRTSSESEAVPEVETPPPKENPRESPKQGPLQTKSSKRLMDKESLDTPKSKQFSGFVDDITSFMDEFLVDRVDARFSRTGRQATIDEAYHQKIQKLKILLGNRMTINGYLHNVLKKHFEEYGHIIDRLIENPNDYKNH